MDSKNRERCSTLKLEYVLIELGLAKDLDHAKSLISCGLVLLGDQAVTSKTKITEENLRSKGLRVKYSKPYVSRGAVKLNSVFKHYDLNVKGFRCLDVGVSTGGFTQLLLEKGAEFVYAVDVGRGIIDHKLRTDKRVMVLEEINARYMDQYDVIKKEIGLQSVDLVVMDLSFISLTSVIPSILPFLKKEGYLIPLVKPQFEATKDKIEEGGIITDAGVIKSILEDMAIFLQNQSLDVVALIQSDLKGPSGNQEYFYVTTKKL